MRLSYSQILAAHLRNIGKPGSTDATIIADFKYSLGVRYQLIYDTIASYINQDTLTASTVASQQYYYYPPGTVSIDSATVAIGSVQYTLTPIYSQELWNWWNALQIQPTSIPQFIFPRKDDFGIWPIPQAAYTISFQRFFRDRNLTVADYTTGSVSVTNGSATVTGSGTTFTSAMAGRWFTINDATVPGQGYWYRIAAYVNATSLTLETYWAGSNASGATYLVGESPELPEGAHVLLPNGTSADYYSGLRNDTSNAARFDNAFWTGSMANSSRDMDEKTISGGLIGLYRKFKDRERDVIVRRQPPMISPSYKIFAQTIS